MIDQVINIAEKLREIQEDLQEKYDTKSENWQESENGEAWSQAIYEIEELVDGLEHAQDYTQEVTNDKI